MNLVPTIWDSAGAEINRKHLLSTYPMEEIVLATVETKRKNITVQY